MKQQRTWLVIAGLSILAIISLVGLTWVNYNYAVQFQVHDHFLPRWLGIRLFISQGTSPFSDQTTAEIEQMASVVGVSIDQPQGYFLYPFHAIYIFAPFSLITDYELAQAIWMTTLQVATFMLIVISISLSNWRISRFLWVVVVLFGLLWYYSVIPTLDGNVTVFLSFLLVAALLSLRSGYDILAGILLALLSIKPHLVGLLVLFILIWGGSQKRWSLIWSCVAGWLFLLATTSILIPDWLIQNLRQLVIYFQGTTLISPGNLLYNRLPGIGRQIGWAITAFMLLILLREWRAAIGNSFRWFFWTACVTLVVTPLIGIPTAPQNHILLLPAVVLILATWNERWRVVGSVMLAFSIFLLFFGIWGYYLFGLQSGFDPNRSAVLFFVLPVFTLGGLYWVRWWAVRQPRLPIEELIDKIE